MKSDIVNSLQKLNRLMQRYSSKVNPNSQGRAQGRVLRVVFENDGIIAKELAAILDIRPSSLTDKLDKLEEDGNLVRVRDRRDMRIVRIYITDRGKEVIARRAKEKGVVKKEFSDCLTQEEKDLFCNLCTKMSNSLKEIIQEEAERSNLVLLELKNKQSQQDDDISIIK